MQATSVGPQHLPVVVYTQMSGLMSKENSDWPEESICVEELMNSKVGANCLIAVISNRLENIA